MNNSSPTICIGDLLNRPKALGFVHHIGVIVGSDAVLHNTPGSGEHLATVQGFSGGRPMTVRHTGADAWAVLARARTVLSNPKGYDPIARNCEHTAYEVVSGRPRSPQVVAIFVIGAVVVALLLALNQR